VPFQPCQDSACLGASDAEACKSSSSAALLLPFGREPQPSHHLQGCHNIAPSRSYNFSLLRFQSSRRYGSPSPCSVEDAGHLPLCPARSPARKSPASDCLLVQVACPGTLDSIDIVAGYYYVVQLIIQKGLHTESDESMVYTTTLMDKLETWKNESVGNDAILDDTAAQAYCEQFGLETFQRAENTMRVNKVTAYVPRT
jgi:hypothetical protein